MGRMAGRQAEIMGSTPIVRSFFFFWSCWCFPSAHSSPHLSLPRSLLVLAFPAALPLQTICAFRCRCWYFPCSPFHPTGTFPSSSEALGIYRSSLQLSSQQNRGRGLVVKTLLPQTVEFQYQRISSTLPTASSRGSGPPYYFVQHIFGKQKSWVRLPSSASFFVFGSPSALLFSRSSLFECM